MDSDALGLEVLELSQFEYAVRGRGFFGTVSGMAPHDIILITKTLWLQVLTYTARWDEEKEVVTSDPSELSVQVMLMCRLDSRCRNIWAGMMEAVIMGSLGKDKTQTYIIMVRKKWSDK